MERDTVVEEVYSIKDKLSEEAGHSVERLVEQMRNEINRSEWNYVSFAKKDAAGKGLNAPSK